MQQASGDGDAHGSLRARTVRFGSDGFGGVIDGRENADAAAVDSPEEDTRQRFRARSPTQGRNLSVLADAATVAEPLRLRGSGPEPATSPVPSDAQLLAAIAASHVTVSADEARRATLASMAADSEEDVLSLARAHAADLATLHKQWCKGRMEGDYTIAEVRAALRDAQQRTGMQIAFYRSKVSCDREAAERLFAIEAATATRAAVADSRCQAAALLITHVIAAYVANKRHTASLRAAAASCVTRATVAFLSRRRQQPSTALSAISNTQMFDVFTAAAAVAQQQSTESPASVPTDDLRAELLLLLRPKTLQGHVARLVHLRGTAAQRHKLNGDIVDIGPMSTDDCHSHWHWCRLRGRTIAGERWIRVRACNLDLCSAKHLRKARLGLLTIDLCDALQRCLKAWTGNVHESVRMGSGKCLRQRGRGDAALAHVPNDELASCDECLHGFREPACDNDPPTCSAWYCSRGGPPCYGGSDACVCNDSGAAAQAAQVVHAGTCACLACANPITAIDFDGFCDICFPTACHHACACFCNCHIAIVGPPWPHLPAILPVELMLDWAVRSEMLRAALAIQRYWRTRQSSSPYSPLRLRGSGDTAEHSISTEDDDNVRARTADNVSVLPIFIDAQASGAALYNMQRSTLDLDSPLATHSILQNIQRDPPMIGQPPRHPNEVQLPVDHDFEWPVFIAGAFFEHVGAFREAWGVALAASGHEGIVAFSLSDRRTVIPLSPNTMHFIGDTELFKASYPYTLPIGTANPPCSPGLNAASERWHTAIRNGEMWLWIQRVYSSMFLALRMAVEQPPTSAERIMGPATFKTAAEYHGERNTKHWLWFCRHLGEVKPSNIVPVEWRVDAKRAAISERRPDVRMMLRCPTPITLACAHVSTWMLELMQRPPRARRPDLQQLRHHYNLFAAEYAPFIRHEQIDIFNPNAPYGKMLFLVPIASYHPPTSPNTPRPPVLVAHVRRVGAFGVIVPDGADPFSIAKYAASFLGCTTEPELAGFLRNAQHHLFIVWVSSPPSAVATTSEFFSSPNGPVSAWCAASAVPKTSRYYHVLQAMNRAQRHSAAVLATELNIGKHAAPRPMQYTRDALRWKAAAPSEESQQQWSSFCEKERARHVEIRDLLLDAAQCYRQSEFAEMAANVTTADTYPDVPVPSQGLPTFSTTTDLSLVPFPERPPRLTTSMLARLPPPAIPPGITHVTYDLLIRQSGRRLIAETLTLISKRNYDIYTKNSTLYPLPEFLCLGEGFSTRLTHTDGIGSFVAWHVYWEHAPQYGENAYAPFDYTKHFEPGMNIEGLRKWLGFTLEQDQELLYFLMYGMCNKAWDETGRPPCEIRIARNVASLRGRAKGVARKITQLSQEGKYLIHWLAPAGSDLQSSGTHLSHYIPWWSQGLGGGDKFNSDAKRVLIDPTAPHADTVIYPRHQPHQSVTELSGPEDQRQPVLSFATLSGPTRPAEGQTTDVKWPKEIKFRHRHKYAVCAFLGWLAAIDDTYLVGVGNDADNGFFQVKTAYSEHPISTSYAVLPRCEELWFAQVVRAVMDQGSPPSSGVFCRISNGFSVAFDMAFDAEWKTHWLPTRSQPLRDALEYRRTHLGEEHAKPYAVLDYTDDWDKTYVSPELMILAEHTWIRMTHECGLVISGGAKRQVGTVTKWIGGVDVLNGGFGFLPPEKSAKALLQIDLALANEATREIYESNNGLLVHAADILNFAPGSLHGVGTPLKLPGRSHDLVHLTGDARQRYLGVREQLLQCPAASFMTGVQDHAPDEFHFERPRVYVTSDACTSHDEESPGMYAQALGYYIHLPLDHKWALKHITVTELTIKITALLTFGRLFPHAQLVLEGDSAAAEAAFVWLANSGDLQRIMHRYSKEPDAQQISERAWGIHLRGISNYIADLGSRSRWRQLRTVCKAAGVTLTRVGIDSSTAAVLEYILENTSNYDQPTAFEAPFCNQCLMEITTVEYALGVCSLCAALKESDAPSEREGRIRLRGAGDVEFDPAPSNAPLANGRAVFFYHRQHPYFELTNFFEGYPITVDGNTYATTEHYFQSMKFVPHSPSHAEVVRLATSPREALELTRHPAFARNVRGNWHAHKNMVMLTALRAKFSQHFYLREKLLSTGDRMLVEHTTNDTYWGDGGDGSGLNQLGCLLMQVREELHISVEAEVASHAESPNTHRSPTSVTMRLRGSGDTSEAMHAATAPSTPTAHTWRTQTAARVIQRAWRTTQTPPTVNLRTLRVRGSGLHAIAHHYHASAVAALSGDLPSADGSFSVLPPDVIAVVHRHIISNAALTIQCSWRAMRSLASLFFSMVTMRTAMMRRPIHGRRWHRSFIKAGDELHLTMAGPQINDASDVIHRIYTRSVLLSAEHRKVLDIQPGDLEYITRPRLTLRGAGPRQAPSPTPAAAPPRAPSVPAHGCGVLPRSVHFGNAISLLCGPGGLSTLTPHVAPLTDERVRELAVVMEPRFAARFESANLPPIQSSAVPQKLADSISSVVRAVQARLPLPLRGCVLGAWQLTKMLPQGERGYHFDFKEVGDLIVTVTLEGDGTILLYAEDEPLELQQNPLDFYYIACDRQPVQVDRTMAHAVHAGSSGRLSLTLRFLYPEWLTSPPPSPPDCDARVVVPPSPPIASPGCLDRLRTSPLLPRWAKLRTPPPSPPPSPTDPNQRLTSYAVPAPPPSPVTHVPSSSAHVPAYHISLGSSETVVESPPDSMRHVQRLLPGFTEHATPRRMRKTMTTSALPGVLPCLQQSSSAAATLQPVRRWVRPVNAAAARQLSSQHLADRAANDTSFYALSPSNPEALKEQILLLNDVRDEGIPQGTRGVDENGYKKALRFCDKMDTPILRPTSLEPADEWRELMFYGCLFMDIAENITTRSTDPEITRGRPSSALASIYGYRRVLRDCGCALVDLKGLIPILKGHNARYKREFGDDALRPAQRKPFKRDELLRMADYIDQTHNKVAREHNWSRSKRMSFSAYYKHKLQAGTRDAEDTVRHPTDSVRKRSALTWCSPTGEPYSGTTEQIRANLKNGDLLRDTGGPSKCDPINAWGNKPSYYRLDTSNPLNFPSAWLEYENAYPVPDAARPTTPAFSPTGDHVPYTSAETHTTFRNILITLFGQEFADTHSLHGLRITAAYSYMSMNYSDASIQCLLRWKSAASVLHYASLWPQEFADCTDLLTRAAPEAAFGKPVPVLGPEELMVDLESAIAELTTSKRPPTTDGESQQEPMTTPTPSGIAAARDHSANQPRNAQRGRGGRGGRGRGRAPPITDYHNTLLAAAPAEAVVGVPLVPPIEDTPFTNANTPGRRVWVPASIYEGIYECTDNDGRGWYARAVRMRHGIMTVRFEPSPDGTVWQLTNLRGQDVQPA